MKRPLHHWLYPIAGFAVILGIWQLYADLWHVSKIVLPSPADIVRVSYQQWSLLLR